MSQEPTSSKLRVCAVSYLNTVPLVWGMLHGAERGRFELMFRVPSECADLLQNGDADIGIVPSLELGRQSWDVVPGLGIACRGPVRSILLISKRPASTIRLLAADSSSRTSVALADAILSRKFGVQAEIIKHRPDLESMLQNADAALIIGDPALRIDPAQLPFYTYDLGQEWVEMTGLPMVFAMWAGRRGCITPAVIESFMNSWRSGMANLETIVHSESALRGFPPDLVRRYLTSHIVHELGVAEERGLKLFLEYTHHTSMRVQEGA